MDLSNMTKHKTKNKTCDLYLPEYRSQGPIFGMQPVVFRMQIDIPNSNNDHHG